MANLHVLFSLGTSTVTEKLGFLTYLFISFDWLHIPSITSPKYSLSRDLNAIFELVL